MAYKLFTGYKLLVLHFNKELGIRHYATIIGYRGIELIESWVIEV